MLERDRERGQMILVGGVALALTFVALGVLLNSAAFTGTEAARDDTADPREALSARDDVVEGLEGALFYANYYDYRSTGALSRSLGNDVSLWDRSLANSSAERRTLAGVNLTRVTNGTQIYQDSARNFTNKTGGSDPWQPASDVTGVRRFSMNVSNSSLHDGADSNNAFHVRFRTSGGTVVHELEFYNPGNETVSFNWDAGGSSGTCNTGEKWAVVDVSAGDVAGGNCPLFPAPGDVSGPYSIRYVNPENVKGTYNLVIAGTAADGNVNESAYNTKLHQPPPHQVPAIFNASVEIDHRTATLAYGANVTLDPGTTPRGTVFGVAPPSPREVVFAHNGTGRLMSLSVDGELTRYATTDVEAIGPMQADLDGDGRSEIPYVTSGNALKIIDRTNETSTLVDSGVDKTKTLLGVGTVNGETNAFYVNASGNTVFGVSEGESPEVVLPGDTDTDGISAVGGIADYNNDGHDDLVYVDGSNWVSYYDFETDSATEVGGIKQNNGIGVGEPRDLNGNGTVRAPIFDGSSIVRLMTGNGGKNAIPGNPKGSPSPLTAIDYTGDAEMEVLYVENNADTTLHYVTLSGTRVEITDSNGDPIPVDDSVGVA